LVNRREAQAAWVRPSLESGPRQFWDGGGGIADGDRSAILAQEFHAFLERKIQQQQQQRSQAV